MLWQVLLELECMLGCIAVTKLAVRFSTVHCYDCRLASSLVKEARCAGGAIVMPCGACHFLGLHTDNEYYAELGPALKCIAWVPRI